MISHDSRRTQIDKLVRTSGDVELPDDFWKEFLSSVEGSGDDLFKNHKLLEQITLVLRSNFKLIFYRNNSVAHN